MPFLLKHSQGMATARPLGASVMTSVSVELGREKSVESVACPPEPGDQAPI